MARPPSDVSQRIVRAARDRFLHEGVDGASLRQIAKDAGSNIGMIYYYFPTKDDLFIACLDEIYPKLLSDLTEAVAPDQPAEERLRRVFRRFGTLTDDEVAVIRLMLREALVSSERRQRIIERFMGGHVPLAIATLMEGVQTGRLTDRLPPPVLMMASFALAILPQVLRRLVGDAFPPMRDAPEGTALSDALSDVLLDGIRKR